jgi:hypothetical protein
MLPKVLKRRHIMPYTRRQFLLTTAGSGLGFILPSFYEKALGFWENHGEALILPAANADTVLYALEDNGLSLNLGDPREDPPEMTWREYIDKYLGGGLKTYFEELPYLSEDQKYDLDEEADINRVMYSWGAFDSPWARALNYLDQLDLGPDFQGKDAIGGLEYCFGAPGSSYEGLHADDHVSLSLLQDRLNQLNTRLRIEVITY